MRDSKLEFSIEGKTCILVDDVLYTGRTIRAAIEALFESIKTSLLRGERIELRAEAINLANHFNRGNPSAVLSNPATFGRITTSGGTPTERGASVPGAGYA